jgi:hypothetical protein
MTDMFDRETTLLLGRIDGKLDALSTQSAAVLARIERLELRTGNLETWRESLAGVADRVQTLEAWRSRALGIVAFLAFLGSIAAVFKDELLALLTK